MLTQVVIETSSPTTLDIENVATDEIITLKSISGLSSPGADLYLGEFSREGGYYQGRRAKALAPVLNFRLQPDYAADIEYSDVREKIYRMFMEPQASSDAVQIRLVDDRKPDRYFHGYVETIEAGLFDKEIGAQVNMRTTDAYLRSVAQTSNSNSSGWITLPIAYEGSADTGIEITLKVLANTSSLVLANNASLMVLNYDFTAGDIVTINTNPGSRSIKIGDEDIMGALLGSNWIRLTSSGNLLRAYGAAVGDGKVAITQYIYRAAWWGV